MTIRELRQALFHLGNQDMTVAELREMLFWANDQNDELETGLSMWLELEEEFAKIQERKAVWGAA